VAIGAVETINFGAVQYGTPTPTPTATVFADLTIDGYITEQSWLNSVGSPVADALVSASACGSPAVETTTAEDGYYSLTLPGHHVAGCENVTMSVDAPGYGPWAGEYRVVDLLVDPRVDVLLTRSPGLWLWLPLVMK